MKITTQQLRQVIREELRKTTLNEVKSERMFDLYGYAGIKTEYSDDIVKRYGQKVVDDAIKNAPKYQKFAKEVRKMVSSPLAKEFGLIAQSNASYGGSYRKGDAADGITYIIDLSK